MQAQVLCHVRGPALAPQHCSNSPFAPAQQRRQSPTCTPALSGASRRSLTRVTATSASRRKDTCAEEAARLVEHESEKKRALRADLVGAIAATLAIGLAPGESLAASALDLQAGALNPAIGEVSAGLEAGVLLLYLGGLLSLLAFGTFLVVRQVLVRRELENAAKELQERVRTGQASSEEYFELGAVMLRKKFYTLANKYLIQAVQKWEGDEQELAQVHNALGFSYFSEEKWDQAVAEYEKAVRLQPAYVTAWNNMGDSLEKKKAWEKALKCYETSLMYDPTNRVAGERKNDLQRRVQSLKV